MSDFDFITLEQPKIRTRSVRKKRKVSAKKAPRKQAWEPGLHPGDLVEHLYRDPVALCEHDHHMNCIKCGLMQFSIGMVTGLVSALILIRLLV